MDTSLADTEELIPKMWWSDFQGLRKPGRGWNKCRRGSSRFEMTASGLASHPKDNYRPASLDHAVEILIGDMYIIVYRYQILSLHSSRSLLQILSIKTVSQHLPHGVADMACGNMLLSVAIIPIGGWGAKRLPNTPYVISIINNVGITIINHPSNHHK